MLLPLYASATDAPQAAGAPQPPSAAVTPLETRILGVGEANPDAETLMQGALEARFGPFQSSGSHFLTGTHWFRIEAPPPGIPGTTPVLVARAGLDQPVRVWARQGGQAIPLRLTTSVPKFGGAEDKVFALPAGLDPGQPLYAQVAREGRAVTDLHFSASTLSEVLEQAAAHARVIAFTFGALMAMAISALLIRFVLPDEIYPLYGVLFLLQAIYLAYFSGQGFSWPLLSFARPFANFAYNVPVAVSAAAAALFVRRFANVRLFSPRVYSALAGWRSRSWYSRSQTRCACSGSDASSPPSATSCSSAARSSRWWWRFWPGGAAAIARPAGSSSRGACCAPSRSSPRCACCTRAPTAPRAWCTTGLRPPWSRPPC